MKKKILMIVNYFYPEVASTGQLMTEVCEQLQDDFDITVIAAIPSYIGNANNNNVKLITRDTFGNVNVLRVKVPVFNKTRKLSRIKYIVTYFINAIFAICVSGKQDLIFTISQPPILGGLLGVIGKKLKKAKLVYNIQDFNPEQIEAVKYSKNKVIINIARKLDNYSCKNSDIVLVVGRDMLQTLKKRFDNDECRIPDNVVINNWIDENKVYPLEKTHEKVKEFKNKYAINDKLVFMYSGNIGLYYDLENIIKVICKFKNDERVVFVFVGEGAVKDKLVDYCEQSDAKNVRFVPYQDKEDLIYSLNAADIHIVTNTKGIKGVSVPSKIYGILAVDKLALGILEKGTEARNIIQESNSGFCCDPQDYNFLEETINTIINNYEDLAKNKKSGRVYLEKHLTKEMSIQKYRKLFEDLLA